MKVYIPALGDELELKFNWTFKLHPEQRNLTLIAKIEGKKKTDFGWSEIYDAANPQYKHHYGEKTSGVDWTQYPKEIQLRAGTVLVVDRIYIRKDAKDFDSVTFRIKSSPNKDLEKTRFWAKLADVNRMEIK